MREYETTFIAKAELSDDAVRQLSERTAAIIERHKGIILINQIQGRQTLAYRIEKQAKGNYVFFDYVSANPQVVDDIERALRFDEGVLKFLTVKSNDNVDVAKRKQEIEARTVQAQAQAQAAAVVTEEATEVSNG